MLRWTWMEVDRNVCLWSGQTCPLSRCNLPKDSTLSGHRGHLQSVADAETEYNAFPIILDISTMTCETAPASSL